MPKKRRQNIAKARRRRSKSPQSGDDVVSARDRLKGALQDLLPHSDEESESSDDQNDRWSSTQKLPKRNAIGKKESSTSGDRKEPCGFRQSFKMKLFDRTVDLSHYTDSTPLYPICRAWIANQSNDFLLNRDFGPGDDDVKDSRRLSEDNVFSLPPPDFKLSGETKIRVPKLIPRKSEYNKMDYSESEAPSQEALLKDNLSHWVSVRRSWMQASKENETRYKDSIKLLTNMFYNSQK